MDTVLIRHEIILKLGIMYKVIPFTHDVSGFLLHLLITHELKRKPLIAHIHHNTHIPKHGNIYINVSKLPPVISNRLQRVFQKTNRTIHSLAYMTNNRVTLTLSTPIFLNAAWRILKF